MYPELLFQYTGNIATNVASDLKIIIHFEENLLEPTIYHLVALFELILHTSIRNLYFRK